VSELRTIKVAVDVELLGRAQELHLDVPRLMAAALAERVAATRVLPVELTVSDDNEDRGAFATIGVDPRTGAP
jgi:post-segregation antitoxin (ccd killing protein)